MKKLILILTILSLLFLNGTGWCPPVGGGPIGGSLSGSALDIDTPSKSFSCDVLTADDDFLLWRTPIAITITDIFGVLQSGTSVIGGLDECDANGANPVAVDADITFDGGLDQDDGALTNGSIDAGDWVRWHTTSVVAPGYLTVTIYYEID